MKIISYFCPALAVLLFAATFAEGKIERIEPNDSTGSSKAVVVDAEPLAHTAQFLPINKRGELVGEGDIRKQSEQVLSNLQDALKKAKSGMNQVVRLNVSVKRSELSAEVSKVLAEQFSGNKQPAVTFVGGDLTHADALVAMDAVAVSKVKTRDSSPVHFAEKNSRSSQVTVLPSAGVVYVAGLAGKSDLASATKETMTKIQDAIAHLGLKRGDIVQLKAFLLPMSEAEVVKSEIEKFFGEDTVPPIIYVDWTSPSVPVEIEAIVAAPATKSTDTISFHTPPGISASPVYSRLGRVHGGKRIYTSGLYGLSEPEQDVNDIYEQLDQLLLKTGSSRDHMAKATYYFSDPQSNARLDAFRPKYYSPETPPTASKARVKEVGKVGRGISIDIIAVTK